MQIFCMHVVVAFRFRSNARLAQSSSIYVFIMYSFQSIMVSPSEDSAIRLKLYENVLYITLDVLVQVTVSVSSGGRGWQA